jgi:lipid-A-disaccharide synthase
VVAVLPGSRRGEVERLGPVFAATIAWLSAREPGLHFVVPAATPGLRAILAGQLAGLPAGLVTLVDGQSQQAMVASDVVLLASGTATLEAMLLRRPMVVAYRLAPLTWTLVKGLNLVRVAWVSLPNLLAGEALVPELLQDRAQPALLGAELRKLLVDAAARSALLARFDGLRDRLRQDASARAAAAVERLIATR